MSRLRAPIAVTAGALLLLLVAGCGEPPEDEGGGGPAAPEFSLQSLAGGQVALAELRGRPVVIDFWATWCAPCVHQIPILNELHRRHGARVAVLGVAVDVRGAEVVAPFAEEHEIAYPVLLGDEALAQRYGAPGFPSLFIVSPEGAIEGIHVGVASQEELQKALEPWL